MSSTQAAIDARNAEFWNELCGSSLARILGITEPTRDSLTRFDEAYWGLYPYLRRYATEADLRGRRVLEIGLGYGTLGQLLVTQGCAYYGLDIAPHPVEVMRFRLRLLGVTDEGRVTEGSALALPYPDASMEYVYSIGCLHHTGSLPRAVSEIHRVLVPGGRALIMLYHRHSFRQLLQVPLVRFRGMLARVRHPSALRAQVRALYDANQSGEAAPHTDFVSRREARRLFRDFAAVQIEAQNFDTYVLFRGCLVVPRERLLDNVARVLGLDLYVWARK
ncbi:MAG: class I SAM-dependent methyltransferase [Actinomycetota bacterium]